MTTPLPRGLALALLLATAAGSLAAAQPRSAIPWLSESIRIESRPPPPRPGGAEAPPVRGTEEITVTTLGDVDRDAVGLLAPEVTGLPRDLWGPVPAAEVQALILGQPEADLPAALALFQTILLAEADPPRDTAAAPEAVLLARVDRLLEMGALEDAAALIAVAGPDAPELFRRWFDIGILTNDAEPACAALRQNPALSPTLPARVFCLARGGDWNAAEITLTLGEEVGAISAEEQPLLARFLDPELFEAEPEPPVADPLTPLEFLMREAVGLPRPSGPLPVAFLHHDLAEHAPLRSRMEAAERLVLSGGVTPEVLFAAYRAGAPAASGGVWDRAAAVQDLDAALEAGGAAAGPALVEAETQLADRGLVVALAQAYAADFAALDPAALDADGRAAAFRLLMLAGDGVAAERFAARPVEPAEATLLAIAGQPVAAKPADDLERAAVAGMARQADVAALDPRWRLMLAEGRHGAVLLDALAAISVGGTPDPGALSDTLRALRQAGQDDAARDIALQSLLLGGAR